MGILHEDLCTFMIVFRCIRLRKRKDSCRTCRENQNTHFMFNNFFFFRKSCRLWDNVEKYGTARQYTDGNIIRRMRFVCWTTKATDTNSEYTILVAFPRQQWLRERASTLRYKYTARLVQAYVLIYLNLDSVRSPFPCTSLHTAYQQPQSWYVTTRKTSTSWITFPANGNEIGLCPRLGLMVGTRRVGVMKITRVRRIFPGVGGTLRVPTNCQRTFMWCLAR
jgi:hypothetical protein